MRRVARVSKVTLCIRVLDRAVYATGLNAAVLYDRPVRELRADAVAALDQPSRPSDYVEWFARHYPAVKENTVRMHLMAYTANDRNRRHHASARRRPALLFKRRDDRLEPYDPSVHGALLRSSDRGEDSRDVLRS